MKAYILKLTFENIQPSIWRRLILPAGATFNRLHETIQYATNFQSYMEPYHFFAIETDEFFSTNNGAILEEYKGQKFAGKTVKSPTHIKIDKYLEQQGHLLYTYDFGDDWRIQVELEDTVEDYYFGYPTLLEGEGVAPPEDVGGPPGYEEFLKVYHDPKHPDYLSTYAWAERQNYLQLDIDKVNEQYKFVKYKKTEWQQIDHDNYFVLSDKYRGADYVEIEELPNKDLVIQYAIACSNLYGMIKYSNFLEIYNAQNEPSLSSKELHALLAYPAYQKQLKQHFVLLYRQGFVNETIDHFDEYEALLKSTIGKPFYVPTKAELLRYTDNFYIEKTAHQEKLAKMIAKDFFGGSSLMVNNEIIDLVGHLQVLDCNPQQAIQDFLSRFEMKDMTQLNEYVQEINMIANTTRIWENRGHTPDELFQMEKHYLKPLPVPSLNVIDGGKIGRNDSCPCGSGKKHKKCCGK
ncbi:plasmid pRiA4b ORF-3 family protein [Psychrobacillus sp. OK032]|uniref:plasmid pRiA4b ORF-3 family protein n=1 Tax=Psychrobacillus sp. OK032 TaxID=1884358 RepID=UPI0008C1076B|nr:plasmid pRiA4b ORF-3 family protein [Psychrobacillus sp. OK032]SES37083.1 SEC-C motif-containing protein [Psychrobacillus sp. OK032]